MTTAELIAHDLLSIHAVFFRPDEPFTWASGIKSPVYCDNRLTLTAPAVRDDVENGLAALIRENYPDAEVLMGTATAGGGNTDPKVQARYQRVVDKYNGVLGNYEQVKRFVLVTEPWGTENRFLTPTLKIIRKNIAEYYRTAIEELFK